MFTKARAGSESNSQISENIEDGNITDNDGMIGVTIKSEEIFVPCSKPNKDPSDQYILPKRE